MKTLLPLLLLSFSGELWAQSGELWLIGGGSILLNKGIGSPSFAGTQDDIKLGDGFRAASRIALRFDLRQYETGKPNWSDVMVHQRDLLAQTEASAGIGIYF